jgi:hypothetical protein
MKTWLLPFTRKIERAKEHKIFFDYPYAITMKQWTEIWV